MKTRSTGDIQTYENLDSSSGNKAAKSIRINSLACNDMPLLLCTAVCRIEVGLPAMVHGVIDSQYGKTIRVRQISDDSSKQVMVYNRGDVDIGAKLIVTGSTIRLALGEPEFGGGAVYVNADMRVDISSNGDYRLHGVKFGPDCRVHWLRTFKGNARLAIESTNYHSEVIAKLKSVSIANRLWSCTS